MQKALNFLARPGLRSALLNFGAGLLLALAFAPLNLWPLGLAALLFFCQQMLSSPRLTLRAYCFGLGLFLAGIHWVYLSLYNYGNAGLTFSLLTNITLILVFALFPATVGWLLPRLAQTPGQRALLLPLLWGLAEYGRSYFLSGFPWLSLGYMPSPLRWLAPLGGMWLVGWATMSLCCLLALAWEKRSWRPAALALVLFISGWAAQFLTFVRPEGKPLTVALIQGNIDQLQKFEPMRMRKNMEMYVYAALERKEELIILPETAFTHFEDSIAVDVLEPLSNVLMMRNQVLVTGIPSGDMDKDLYYNAIVVLGDGSGRYYKRHLLPFGEFLPLRSVFEFFRDYVEVPLGDFTRGDPVQPPLFTRSARASASICYEAAFGRDIRRNVAEANYLINISNDGWFKGSILYDQHLQMNQMRALEMGRPLARATNTGLTALIDQRGQVVKVLERDVRGVLSGEIQPHVGLTPYVRWGNRIFELVLLLNLLVALGLRRLK